MECWKLPQDVCLKPILEWCLEVENANRLLVANRLDYFAMKSHNKREFLDPEAVAQAEKLFQGRILRRIWVRNWPGTLSTKMDGLVFVIELDADIIDEMTEVQPKLFDWLGPGPVPLPEDLAAYRNDAPHPCFFSVTHEKDAWIVSDKLVPFDCVSREEFVANEFYVPVGEKDFIK